MLVQTPHGAGTHRSYDEAVSHRVLGDRARLAELQQVVRPAGLRPGSRETPTAERLAPDHRAGDLAVDVEVADGRARGDARDRRRAAAEEPGGQRERRGLDGRAGGIDAGDDLDAEDGAEDLLLA